MLLILEASNCGTPLILECPYLWKVQNSDTPFDLILERPYGVFTLILRILERHSHHLFWNAPNLECPL